jgi:hypothetical protein
MFARLQSLLRRGLGLHEVVQVMRNMDRSAEKSYQVQREALLRLLIQEPRYADNRRLNRHEFGVFSQSGQDGIIEEIFRRIGTTNKLFVEFGVGMGGGFENNSTYLLAKGWNGCWIEADDGAYQQISKQMGHLIRSSSLKVLGARITVENIVNLFEKLSVPREFDLLSIDIDSFDYWVWKRLGDYRPRVVVIEYNSFLPATAHWVLPYDQNRHWEEMSMEFGASLKAFEKLGKELGYCLVGCDLTGSDAFFVHQDLAGDQFCDPFTAENHYEPMRYHLIQRWGYRRMLSEGFGIVG